MTEDSQANEASKAKKDQVDEFIQASQEGRSGMVSEFWAFLKHNKKWWLTPIILVILLVGLLVIASGSGVGPFIYALF